MNNNHPRDSKFVAVVERWSLLRSGFILKDLNWDSKMVVSVGRLSLFGGGRFKGGERGKP